MRRPPVREMVKQAVKNLPSGPVRYSEIKNYIISNYGSVKENTIEQQIRFCTVNHPSRLYGPENQEPRVANDVRYDFLYRVGRGLVDQYNPKLHGVWEIRRDENGNFVVVITAV